MTQQTLDEERLRKAALDVFGALAGALTSAMIHLGDRLGLYRAMRGAGTLSSSELASRTGLAERWVREWMFQQGAAKLLEARGEDRFELAPEMACVLADEAHPAFGAGPFASLPATMGTLELLAGSFSSGLGLPYDALGADGAVGLERGFGPWFRAMLVPHALPRVADVVERLERGAVVADVGCGAGVALVEMARAFPRAKLHGYEVSAHAIARARKNVSDAGVENVEIRDAASDPLPRAPTYDFVTTFDCLHDMTDPAGVTRAIRSAMQPDGVWLIAEIKAHASYDENVARNPMAALMYGFSVTTCMSSALSEPGGAGLGTLGLHADLARRMTRDAGFTRFEPLDLGHAINTFYVVRP